jgi:hypothetical protein
MLAGNQAQPASAAASLPLLDTRSSDVPDARAQRVGLRLPHGGAA